MLGIIHARLGFGAKLALIAALFLAPTALLATLFVKSEMTQITFANAERDGARALQRVWAATTGGAQLQGAMGGFNSADAANAFAAAKDPASRLSAGVSLIGAIADGSNLTLDPDLDSFYTQDAVTVRLPALYVTLSQLDTALRGTDPAALSRALDHMETAAGQAQTSLQAAMKDNLPGRTKGALEPTTASLAAAVDGVKSVMSNPAAAHARIMTVQTRTNAAWTASNVELNRLLTARIDKLSTDMWTNLGIVGLALLIASGLAFAISRALSGRIAQLVTAMERLSDNDTEVSIPFLTDRNETGRIAATLAIFKQGIIERNGLQAEAAVVHGENKQKLHDVEAAFKASGEDLAVVVRDLAQGLSNLSDGDLTFRLNEAFAGDYEKLRSDFNGAMSRLEQTVTEVGTNTNGIARGTEEIAQASDDLSRRTEQQAASLEQTAAALDQITATVKKTAAGAKQASSVVGSCKEQAESSGAIVSEAVEAMSQIEKSSHQISQIIGVIDEIAFQTNLLALNAGVEAARAGDAGKGFAVVASEVRGLAGRSAEAAKEIKSLISTSAKHVTRGVGLVAETGKALSLIMGKVAEIDTLAAEIAASAQEQATGLNEVNTAVNQMDQVVQQNAAMVEQATAATHSLNSETEELARLIAHFKVSAQPAVDSPVAQSLRTDDAYARVGRLATARR